MLRDAAFTALAIAATVSIPVARRRRTYLPVAVFLWYVVLAGLLREQIVGYIVRPAKEAMRAAGIDPLGATYPAHVVWASHLEHVLFLGTLVGAGALSAVVFFRNEQRPGTTFRALVTFGIGWATFAASMVLSFPRIRGHHVEMAFYLPAGVGSILASAASVISWKRRRLSVEPEHLSAVALMAVDTIASLKFLVRSGAYSDIEVGASLVVYSALALMQGVWLRWTSRSS